MSGYRLPWPLRPLRLFWRYWLGRALGYLDRHLRVLRLACLIAVVTFALAVGFMAGWGAHITLATSSHHRWMPPPLPGDLALYEPPTISAGASTPVAAPDAHHGDRTPAPMMRSTAAQAGGGQGRQPLTGWATWCAPTPTRCQSWGGDAMLAAVPSFRWGDDPYRVEVCATTCVFVTVVSFCACGDRHGIPTVIDLSPAAFRTLAPLRRGVYAVTVEMP